MKSAPDVNVVSLIEQNNFSFKDIEISFDGKDLILSNKLIERKINFASSVPSTESLIYKPLNQEFCEKKTEWDFSFAGLNMPAERAVTDFSLTNASANIIHDSWRDSEHVRLDIHLIEKIQQTEFIISYILYPGRPYFAVQNSIKSAVTPNLYWTSRGSLYQANNLPQELLESCVDCLKLQPSIKVQKAVEFRGRTDYSDEQVIEHTGLQEKLNGNLLFCNDAECGLFFLQEAPPSSERRDFEDHDFRINEANTVFSCNWGIHPSEVKPDIFLRGYRHVIGIYEKDAEAMTLKKYLKLRFPECDEDYAVTVNPWGAGCFPELVNEQFLLDEIEATAEIGATHYQIDDGWQKGRALRELTQNNRCITPEFWDISEPHLPNGFDNLLSKAQSSNVELALWVAPTFTNEYRDWKEFADILFDFHQKYGIRMFKVDAVKIRTKEAEDNLEKLVKSLRERSNGKIFFNFDTTNGQRPGYFMFLEYGNIFLENRYVCHGWGVGYHPENTLNNLWRLSKYMRPQVLQIEVPNPEDINYEFYQQKQRLAPDTYPTDYWLAIAMFSNPLVWLAPSNLSPESKKTFRQMLDLHIKYREKIFNGEILPIGAEPDGNSITGFMSYDDSDNSGMLIVYRENLAPETSTVKLPIPISSKITLSKIYESCKASTEIQSDGTLKISFDRNCSFAIFDFKI